MKTFLLVIILLVVFVGIIWFSGNRREEISFPQPTLTPTQPQTSPSPTPTQQTSPTSTLTSTPKATITPKIITINITDSGFVPSNITINIGDIVKFINQDSRAHWPASAIHPVHEVYPGSSISKCGTSEADSIFDACRGLEPGQSFSFTFNIKGSWPYHDHLNPSIKGTVIVQ